MKANLTYSIISAELKQGMYLLVNDHLGYISRMNAEKAIISFYYEDGKVIKLGKQEMTREDAISTYSTSVIKLIAIVDGNPVSINHQNYKKIFSPMLTFEKGADESYISQFIKTKEWSNPIYGDISPVYSMLKVGDVVNIISLPIVDAYSLYDPMKRLVRVKSKKGNSKYIVVRMDNEYEDDFEITVNRTDVVLGDKDKYDLFNMNFDALRNLILMVMLFIAFIRVNGMLLMIDFQEMIIINGLLFVMLMIQKMKQDLLFLFRFLSQIFLNINLVDMTMNIGFRVLFVKWIKLKLMVRILFHLEKVFLFLVNLLKLLLMVRLLLISFLIMLNKNLLIITSTSIGTLPRNAGAN